MAEARDAEGKTPWTRGDVRDAEPSLAQNQWPLWEVFTQKNGGVPHEHAGSVHASDSEMALQNARDVYARRGGVVSLWVVASNEIVASKSEDAGPLFDPGADKIYRHPQFYKIPRGLKGF